MQGKEPSTALSFIHRCVLCVGKKLSRSGQSHQFVAFGLIVCDHPDSEVKFGMTMFFSRHPQEAQQPIDTSLNTFRCYIQVALDALSGTLLAGAASISGSMAFHLLFQTICCRSRLEDFLNSSSTSTIKVQQ